MRLFFSMVMLAAMITLRPFVLRDFFFEVANGVFFCFQASFPPESEDIEPALLAMSLTTLGEVSRPVSSFSRVAVSRISDY